MERYVYFFGADRAEGGREMKALLGGKGANLAEMARIGLPVPPGFTITTAACREYLRTHRLPAGLRDEVAEQLRALEAATGKSFGRGPDPLLVSVRSGAAISMPGMMDTILNLGLNDETVAALAANAHDERFAYDSYRRFIQMYADVVLGVHVDRFEQRLEAAKLSAGVRQDNELDAAALRRLVADFLALVREETGRDFPTDPEQQLWGAIEAVFQSWETPRAVAYRKHNRIPDDLGTAVNLCTMVFGNLGEDSGTGVAFTRDPSTGERRFFGEFLINAQGEDVVAGIRDPLPIAEMERRLPEAYVELVEAQALLERHYREMQDLEFTIERGTLYLLQTRTGKRTARAAVRIATDMVDEGLISEDEAAKRGAAGEDVILVRRETSPEDFHGMVAARAILTARGGMTSHAAVVARGMGKCCVVGASEITVDAEDGRFRVRDTTVERGDWITLDGSTGRVLLGRVPTARPELSGDFERLMAWADAARRLGVRANADTPADAATARRLGAEGIGLCRTEHMFFEGSRIDVVREMILAETTEEREAALERLLPMQRDDFVGIFRAMDGLPVTIRLLDPPLHEFLPRTEVEIEALAERIGRDAAQVRTAIERHHEANPMLGHRGVRIAITYPEIARMQARAILEAALEVQREGVEPHPEIMIPLIATAEELRRQRAIVDDVAREVFAAAGAEVTYRVGTMIELPRAALTADEIAKEADFFSFGTNDLTQTTFGLSRDDAGTFLPFYVEHGLLTDDPFQTIDQQGVGQLVEIATRLGRQTKPSLKVGICGEHGGDPRSVVFFDRVGLDYVSCSPYRVPVARLAAAHAALCSPKEAKPAERAAVVEMAEV
jgi:pyruvate,orthophosphate dikinase